MRLLVVCPEYLPFPGGAERTLHEVLVALRPDFASIEVLVPDERRASLEEREGIRVRRLEEAGYLAEVARAAAGADRILLQQLFVFRTVRNIPVDRPLRPFAHKIAYLASVDPQLLGDCVDAPLVIACSDWHAKRFPAEVAPLRLYPLMTSTPSKEASGRGRHIAIVNPEKMKGGEIFRAIVEGMPDESFVVQLGRGTPVPGLELPNVSFREPAADLASLLADTDVLLMPSRVPETFGRAALEAAMAGCLVLCHRVAGTAELPLPEESFVDGLEPAKWIARLRAVRAFDDGERAALRERHRERMRAFDTGWEASRAAILKPPPPAKIVREPLCPETADEVFAEMLRRLGEKPAYHELLRGLHELRVDDQRFRFTTEPGAGARPSDDLTSEPTTCVTMSSDLFMRCGRGETCFEHETTPGRPGVTSVGSRPIINRLSAAWTELAW